MPSRTSPSRLFAAATALLAVAGCEQRMPLAPVRRVAPGQGCDACHGAPPATGAHLLHAKAAFRPALVYGDLAVLEDYATGGTDYGFGCGHCHPLDPAAHFADVGNDGLPDLDLTPPLDPALAGTLKARNAPTAAWDRATGTCSGVWCHSTGTAVADYKTTPPWTAAPGTLGCDGCHGNPPSEPSAGPSSARPNGHLQLGVDGWEWGHFAGMPGPYHPSGSKHGGGPSWPAGQAAAPITCQACHFDTVDPAAVGPGGFYWLDTTGSYQLPGGDPTRIGTRAWNSGQCRTCHDGVGAPVGRGRVLPLRHVNGRADVAFDVRPALPPTYATGLPPLVTSDPVGPYYMSGWNILLTQASLPAGAVLRDATDGTQVFSASLVAARYDPATRTCTNVACHLARQQQVDAVPPLAQPLRWGDPYDLFNSCQGCHPP